MPKNKVYLTADGGKSKAGAEDAAFVVNADEADDFAKRLRGSAPAPSGEPESESKSAAAAKK